MARSIQALVEPVVLRWARESIDLSPVAASRKIGVPDDRVDAWESGDLQPTVSQLREAAKVYKRSLAVFFLAEPPADFDTLRDFRRQPDAGSRAWSPELHAEYRRAQAQRDSLLELADLEEDEPERAWNLDPLPSSDSELARKARAAILGLSPLTLPTGQSASPYEHLNAWVAGLEVAGVLVMATKGGRVEPSEMRAFSLYAEQVPVIVVNGADSARGRLFSLLHEYAHLLLHTGGVCDTVSDLRAVDPNRRLETRCNGIAAEILMPRGLVIERPEVRARETTPTAWDYQALRTAAAPFGVSAEAFLRRLVTIGRVPMEFYLAKRAEFLAAYEEDEARGKAAGGDWYRNTVRDLGKGYVRRVADAHSRRVIDSDTAASYLDVKVGQIPRLAESAALQAAV